MQLDSISRSGGNAYYDKSPVIMWDFCLNLCSANKTYAIRLRPSSKQLLIFDLKRLRRAEEKRARRRESRINLLSLQSLSHFFQKYFAANTCYFIVAFVEICHFFLNKLVVFNFVFLLCYANAFSLSLSLAILARALRAHFVGERAREKQVLCNNLWRRRYLLLLLLVFLLYNI